MTWIWFVVAVLLALVLGIGIGEANAEASAILRADRGTPHYMRGDFYYIISEHEYVNMSDRVLRQEVIDDGS
jgi:hypothetical protein